MTRDETKQLLMIISAYYPRWKPPDPTVTLNAWHRIMSGYDYNLMEAALMRYVITDTKGFEPTVGQLIEQIALVKIAENPSPMEAWSMVYGRMHSSIYYAESNFDSLPKIVQRAVGSPETLRSWAIADTSSVTVIQANFLRTYNSLLAHQKEYLKIPSKIDKLIAKSVGMLEDKA